MKIADMFGKRIDRAIKGVIKADDEEGLLDELEEYVLTDEAARLLGAFLDEYNRPGGDAGGAWLSGWFGSGKSHLLKMLALLLGDRTVGGRRAADILAAKCGGDGLLKGAMRKAASTPSMSILFNIAQKANCSRDDADALLGVFSGAFDEACGYCGTQGYVARFERDLDRRGAYDLFKVAYEGISGMRWEGEGRRSWLMEPEAVEEAYAKATGAGASSAAGIMDRYARDYRLSIDDFVGRVQERLKAKGRDFRINFLVDEVGQYVGDKVRLMVDLQTLAETLSTRCKGRAWLVVTAQSDVEKVVGQWRDREQGSDFSRIKDRFAVQMQLTSAGVGEVIQKRLLAKTPEADGVLRRLHDRERGNFATLFDFADGSMTFKAYRDADEFVGVHPFVPYQFQLFKEAVAGLSEHGAFQGRYGSVGERSMLKVFQSVVLSMRDLDEGRLATFDRMYDGIEAEVKPPVKRSVQSASQRLDDAFAVRVLKALFMVKYVPGFKATPHNVRVLMQDGFDANARDLARQVDDALALLERETLIQRNGDAYEYLTNVEQDVENEIRNEVVDGDRLADQLNRLIFTGVLASDKIRYDNGWDYPFSRIVDDHRLNKGQELTIRVVTPFDPAAGRPDLVVSRDMGAAGRHELLVVMDADARFAADLMRYLQTEAYIRRNGAVRDDLRAGIINAKGARNEKRAKELQRGVDGLLGRATLLVHGIRFDGAAGNERERVAAGFRELVKGTYRNLSMIGSRPYGPKDVEAAARRSDVGTLGGRTTEAEDEVLARIEAMDRQGKRVTAASLTDEVFGRSPYGWGRYATLAIVAGLQAKGLVDVRKDGALLDGKALAAALLNTREAENLILSRQAVLQADLVDRFRKAYGQLADRSCPAVDARGMGEAMRGALEALAGDLRPLPAMRRDFPFLAEVEPVVARLEACLGKTYDWYLGAFLDQADELVRLKLDVVQPVLKFMRNSHMKDAYDAARRFRETERADLARADAAKVAELGRILDDPGCYRDAGSVRGLRRLHQELEKELEARRDEALTKALAEADRLEAGLPADAGTAAAFGDLRERLRSEHFIDAIEGTLRRFKNETYVGLLAKASGPVGGEGTGTLVAESSARPEKGGCVPGASVAVGFAKTVLDSEADVDAYAEALRMAFRAQIRAGRRISL